MNKILILIGMNLAAFSLLAADVTWEDLLNHNSGAAACDKMPLSGSGSQDDRLVFHDYPNGGAFLKGLSEYVYSFDKLYLEAASKVIEDSEYQDLTAIFVLNALQPYFNALGYPELKRRYLDVALENLACLNNHIGVQNITSLKNIQIFQVVGVKLLTQSLTSSRTLLSEAQKGTAEELIRFYGDILAKGISEETLKLIAENSSNIESHLTDVSTNPFLRSRSATDLSVARYLLLK